MVLNNIKKESNNMKLIKPKNPKAIFDLGIKTVKKHMYDADLRKFAVDEILATPYKLFRLYYLFFSTGEYEVLDEGMSANCDSYNMLIRFSPEPNIIDVMRLDFVRVGMA